MAYIDESTVQLNVPSKTIDIRLPAETIINLPPQERPDTTGLAPLTLPPKEPEKASPSTVLQLPSESFCPANGFYFDQYATVSIPIASVVTSIISYTIPMGMEGYLKFFGQDVVGSSADWLVLTWYLRKNGSSVPPYGNITRQLGTVTELTEIICKLDQGDVVELLAANSGAGAITVWGRLKGWVYPKT